jgi:hypothetical protein
MKLFFFIFLISHVLFAATEIISGPGDPQFKTNIDLSTILGDAQSGSHIGSLEKNATPF